VRRLCLPLALTVVILVPAPAAVLAQPGPTPFLEDLAFPTNMAFAPDGTLFFTEKETGNVRVVTLDGELLERPLVTLPVVGDAERGLLGIAVHPDFAREPWLYLYLSDAADGRNRLIRVRVAGHVAEGAPETLLDGLSAAAGYHNGGDLVFGLDGMLYVSVGEAHEPDRAQDPGDIGGKVLRLTPEGDVPADNPFGDDPAWSIGHRNSFGLCVDPATGELWETENGPDRDDEVNLIEPGANYGWPEVTGVAGDDRFRDPVVVFPEPIAITGCAVADGDLWFGSFDGRLWRLPRAARARGEAVEVASFRAGVSDVLLGPDGDLYVATADSIWRLEGVSRSSPSASSSASAAPTTEGPARPTPARVDEPDDGTSARTWVAVAAFLVLTGALWARFAAGRRLRRQGGSD
jgi:glucose/arabinose dehydrogenase